MVAVESETPCPQLSSQEGAERAGLLRVCEALEQQWGAERHCVFICRRDGARATDTFVRYLRARRLQR